MALERLRRRTGPPLAGVTIGRADAPQFRAKLTGNIKPYGGRVEILDGGRASLDKTGQVLPSVHLS